MLINVARTLDTDKLNKEINIYEGNHNGNAPKYLVMNCDTKNKLAAQLEGYCTLYIPTINSSLYGKYRGIPIAECGGLAFGEIDLVE